MKVWAQLDVWLLRKVCVVVEVIFDFWLLTWIVTNDGFSLVVEEWVEVVDNYRAEVIGLFICIVLATLKLFSFSQTLSDGEVLVNITEWFALKTVLLKIMKLFQIISIFQYFYYNFQSKIFPICMFSSSIRQPGPCLQSTCFESGKILLNL